MWYKFNDVIQKAFCIYCWWLAGAIYMAWLTFYTKENICTNGLRIMSSLVIPNSFNSGRLFRAHHCHGMIYKINNRANIVILILKSWNSKNGRSYQMDLYFLDIRICFMPLSLVSNNMAPNLLH